MHNQRLFDTYVKGQHWDNHPTAYAERFARFLADRGFVGLLADAGCGSGRDVHVFTENGLIAIGIDISESEVNRASELHPACSFYLGDIEHLTMEAGCVGAWFAINVVHYVDQKRALAEMRRTLGSGGFLFIHFNLSIVDASGTVDYAQDEADILALLSEWKILEKSSFIREDELPKPHTHRILELILQKPQ